MQTRSITRAVNNKEIEHLALLSVFISQIEPKKINEALQDADWIEAMEEELEQFERNKVWKLVPRPNNQTVIGTRWVFRNKMNEEGIVVRNKARLSSTRLQTGRRNRL